MKRLPITLMLIAMMGLSGCETPGGGGYIEGGTDAGGGLDPEMTLLLVRGVEQLVVDYLAVKIEGEPTPEQILVLGVAKLALNAGLLKLEQASLYAEAARLRAKAGLEVEPIPELEPL